MFIDGKMVFKENLKKSAETMGIRDRFAFYQDNDLKHTSYIVEFWCLYHCSKVFHPPSQSPDINVIKHLWDKLEKKIRKTPIKSKQHLKERFQEEWQDMCKTYTRKLVQSVPD